MKKTTLVVLFASLALVFASVGVNAETGTSEPMMPAPIATSGFVQLNSLTVASVSATTPPAEIVTNGTPTGCLNFMSQNSAEGAPTPCPLPAQARGAAEGSASGGSAYAPPSTMPPVFLGYRIEVSANTELMLRDRTAASLSDFSQGDQINVFGFYNPDGSIQALLVRDTSKPAETQTMQLNNVALVSVSGTSVPATLAVTQASGYPCFGFMGNAPAKAIACPMGMSSFSANPATANVTAPAALAPNWMMLRKYVVNVDARTIILDRNRNVLSLSSLSTGDSLNIYGESSDNGQTITADIIRDLSIPAMASTYTGTVTAMNTDGSFVIQMGNGQTVTVQNPMTVGQTVTIRGLLNSVNSTISSVSQINIGN